MPEMVYSFDLPGNVLDRGWEKQQKGKAAISHGKPAMPLIAIGKNEDNSKHRFGITGLHKKLECML